MNTFLNKTNNWQCWYPYILETKLVVFRKVSLEGHSRPYRVDWNCHRVGITFVREDIPSKLLPTANAPIKGFFIKLNLRKKIWLHCNSYNPDRNTIDSQLDSLIRSLAFYSSTYKNYIIIVNFNVVLDNAGMSDFYNTLGLVSLIKEPKCYRNPKKLPCVDHILRNKHLVSKTMRNWNGHIRFS